MTVLSCEETTMPGWFRGWDLKDLILYRNGTSEMYNANVFYGLYHALIYCTLVFFGRTKTQDGAVCLDHWSAVQCKKCNGRQRVSGMLENLNFVSSRYINVVRGP